MKFPTADGKVPQKRREREIGQGVGEGGGGGSKEGEKENIFVNYKMYVICTIWVFGFAMMHLFPLNVFKCSFYV